MLISASYFFRNQYLFKASIWCQLGLINREPWLASSYYLRNEHSITKMQCFEVQEVSWNVLSRGPGRCIMNQKLMHSKSTLIWEQSWLHKYIAGFWTGMLVVNNTDAMLWLQSSWKPMISRFENIHKEVEIYLHSQPPVYSPEATNVKQGTTILCAYAHTHLLQHFSVLNIVLYYFLLPSLC